TAEMLPRRIPAPAARHLCRTSSGQQNHKLRRSDIGRHAAPDGTFGNPGHGERLPAKRNKDKDVTMMIDRIRNLRDAVQFQPFLCIWLMDAQSLFAIATF